MADQAATLKTYTRGEVAKHNTNKDTWLIIHNNVYDVVAFLNEHPGGEEVLLEQAGKDASENFEDVGHSSDAREMMAKFKIGEIIDAERTNVPERSEPAWFDQNKAAEEPQKKSWILPLLLGLAATFFYKYFFSATKKE